MSETATICHGICHPPHQPIGRDARHQPDLDPCFQSNRHQRTRRGSQRGPVSSQPPTLPAIRRTCRRLAPSREAGLMSREGAKARRGFVVGLAAGRLAILFLIQNRNAVRPNGASCLRLFAWRVESDPAFGWFRIGHQAAHLHEGAHDLDVHLHGGGRSQYAGQHGHAVFGEHPGRLSTPATSGV
jgi:hypothetical protein